MLVSSREEPLPRTGTPSASQATAMTDRRTTLLPGSSVNRKCPLVIADHPIGVSSSQSATV